MTPSFLQNAPHFNPKRAQFSKPHPKVQISASQSRVFFVYRLTAPPLPLSSLIPTNQHKSFLLVATAASADECAAALLLHAQPLAQHNVVEVHARRRHARLGRGRRPDRALHDHVRGYRERLRGLLPCPRRCARISRNRAVSTLSAMGRCFVRVAKRRALFGSRLETVVEARFSEVSPSDTL